MKAKISSIYIILLILFSGASYSQSGVSLYLPLNIDPIIESDLQRLFVFANETPLKRPYSLRQVKQSLAAIKETQPNLFERINTYLQRYDQEWGLAYLSTELSVADDTQKNIPNHRGKSTASNYALAASGFWQASDYAKVSLGAYYHEQGDFLPLNTFVALGNEYIQLDIGMREHWYSPFQDSSMLLSSNAQPSPSITISNPEPLTAIGFKYDVFWSVLEEVDCIKSDDESRCTPGKPGHMGMQFSINPVSWWSGSLTRTMQIGGGEKEVSFSDFWLAFWDPVSAGNSESDGYTGKNISNQQLSIQSRFNINTRIPFSVYFEYAGEDSRQHKPAHLGNPALSVGSYFPDLFLNTAFSFEYSHWQNAWYVHHIYTNGYINGGNGMGHWAADERYNDVSSDSSGASSAFIGLNHILSKTEQVELKLRTLKAAAYAEFDYVTGYEIEAHYLNTLSFGKLGLGLYLGRTQLDEQFINSSLSYYW